MSVTIPDEVNHHLGPLSDAERARRYRRRNPERVRAAAARRNALRVWVGRFYAGYVTRESTARNLNAVIRRESRDRKNQSGA